jgi:alkanesulfonate monooxygenase SsuD/methylene tetrahydromethanopterin reductase-like flavin-dependent oxidoreductase (luciferase family)
MRYGLSLPNGGECATPQFLLELAVLAEEAGWEGIYLEDYICYTNDAYPVPSPPTIDPWVALAALALQTKRVLLGTTVTPLPRRRPWKLAREAVSVDVLSNGRLIVGVGSGDVREPGFSHFGEERDAKHRAELLDEGLDILAGLWRGEPFSYKGTHYRVEEVAFLPKPVQQPRIPIWVGGGWPNKGPVQRALRWDGAILYKETHGGPWQDMTAQEVRQLRGMVEQKRGPGGAYDIVVGGRRRGEDWKQEQALIQTLAEAGATWWVEWIPPSDRQTMRAAVKRGPLRPE